MTDAQQPAPPAPQPAAVTPPPAQPEPAPYSPTAAAPAGPKPPSTMLATSALILGGAVFLLYLVVKVLSVVFNNAANNSGDWETFDVLATIFGVLGLLAVIPAAFAVVLGHLALRRRPDGVSVGRARAGMGLALGYVAVLQWGNRILIAIIGGIQYGDFAYFLSDMFWWA